jgi:hypothetical protein
MGTTGGTLPPGERGGGVHGPEQVLYGGLAQLGEVPVRAQARVHAVGVAHLEPVGDRLDGRLGKGTPPGPALCTSRCGRKDAIPRSCSSGGAIITSTRPGRPRCTESATASRYIRGQRVTSTRITRGSVSRERALHESRRLGS